MTAAEARELRDLAVMLSRAGHGLTGRLTAALAESGLTPRMQCVLVHALERDRTQAQLAELADLDKTTMVATADELEEAGYARRVPSPHDRRARIIAVTEAGREAALIGQRIVDQVHAEALRAMPAERRRAFVAVLRHLIEAESPPPGGGLDLERVRRRRQVPSPE